MRIRGVAHRLGQGGHVDEIVAVWSTFHLLGPSRQVVAAVRAAGTPCYLATNQDTFRAACMRRRARYDELLDGSYYSCDIGAAKPAAAFFDHVTADLALLPEQVLFLDDQPANVAGARSACLSPSRRAALLQIGCRADRPAAVLRDPRALGARWGTVHVGDPELSHPGATLSACSP